MKPSALPQGIERKKYVRTMFNAIAHRYDLLNHLLSFGIDIYWRGKTISFLRAERDALILDLACGTGDLAVTAVQRNKCRVVGVDIALQMLHIGRGKLAKKHLLHRIDLLNGDGEQLPFKDASFDGAMIAFGIRNMGDMDMAMKEVHRILKEDAPFVVLEFSLPTFALFRIIYLWYFKHILPFIGRMISGDSGAYSYLPESVDNFPGIREFRHHLSKTGFNDLQHRKLLNGIAVIYRGKKKS